MFEQGTLTLHYQQANGIKLQDEYSREEMDVWLSQGKLERMGVTQMVGKFFKKSDSFKESDLPEMLHVVGALLVHLLPP